MACNLPSSVSFSTSTNSATMYYTAGWNCYQVDVNLYSNSGSKYWERYSPCTPFNSNTYNITGLSPDTTYYVILRAIDYEGAWDGTWSSSYYFTTDAESVPDCPTPTYAVKAGSEWDTDPHFIINHQNYDLVSEGYTVTPVYWFDFSDWERTDGTIWLKNVTQPTCTIYYRVKVSHIGFNTTYGPTKSYNYTKRTCASVSNNTPRMIGDSCYFYISHSDYHQPHIRWTKYQGVTFLDGGIVDNGEVYVPLDYGQTAHFYGWQTHIAWYDGPNSSEIDLLREHIYCPPPSSINVSFNAELARYDINVSTVGGYITWIEYTPNNGVDWVLITTSTLTNINCSLNLDSFGSGKTFQFRACNKMGGQDSSSYIYSESYTYYKPTCPMPTSLSATASGRAALVSATCDSGYSIYLEYYDSGWRWGATQPSPLNISITATSMGYYFKLKLAAKCTRNNYIDSGYIYYDVLIDAGPICDILNFTKDQPMIAQNVVKGVNGYTADAIVMPASTWNAFTSKINEFRAYYNSKYGVMGQFPFLPVGSGTVFTASLFNDAVKAINEMFDTYERLPETTGGVTEISADILMGLQNKLNMIT